MAATSGGPWICAQCGKVCRSRGGLTQHSSSHKRHPRIGERTDNTLRVYHPKLDGMFCFALRLFQLILTSLREAMLSRW
jgi:hypothetical protein